MLGTLLRQPNDRQIRNVESAMEIPVTFSIITPTFNCVEKLYTTVDSVLSQTYKFFEYIIIDGNSTDGTVNFVRSIHNEHIKFQSEPDQGIYDAMNKGIKLATGRYLLFLGAGDRIYPDILEKIAQLLPADDESLVYGNVSWNDKIYDGEFNRLKLAHKNICHQAIFYGNKVFDLVGAYETKYRMWEDWHFNMKCFKNSKVLIKYIDTVVSYYEDGGLSSTGDPLFEDHKLFLIRKNLGWYVYCRYRCPEIKYRLSQFIRSIIRRR